jgi:PPE-repeat protein
MPRSRGAVSGLILVILGAWGALIPFVGPHFNFAYTPDQDWAWSTARGWLEVLPGAATVVGGLLLIFSGNRITAMLGSWLAVLAGAWFVVGGEVAPVLGIGSAGDPIAATDRKRAALEISYFSGLGALIVFVGGVAVARLAVRLASDVEALDRVEAARAARAAEPLYSEPQYMSGLEESAPEVSSGAVTKPRVDRFASSEDEPNAPKGWRGKRAGAAARKGAPYLRWPHPQS